MNEYIYSTGTSRNDLCLLYIVDKRCHQFTWFGVRALYFSDLSTDTSNRFTFNVLKVLVVPVLPKKQPIHLMKTNTNPNQLVLVALSIETAEE